MTETEKIRLGSVLHNKTLPEDVERSFIRLAMNFHGNKDIATQTILVTSAIHGEGVTFTAANLAKTIANFGTTSVLYLNFSTQSTKRAGYSRTGPNIFEYIQKNIETTSIDQMVKETDIAGLHFLTFTQEISSNWLQFNSTQLVDFFNEITSIYDYVIIDAAPVSSYQDSIFLSPLVDATLLVIKANVTRREVVQEAIKNLAKVGANICGMVINEQIHFIPQFIYKRL